MIIIKVTNCTHCFKFFEASKSKKKIVLKSHKQINKVYNDKLEFFYVQSERRENNMGCTDYNLTPSKTVQFSMVSITFFLLSFRLKLPGRLLPGRLLAEPCRMRLLLVMLPFLSAVSLSVGECILLTLRLDMELERFRLEEIPRELG